MKFAVLYFHDPHLRSSVISSFRSVLLCTTKKTSVWKLHQYLQEIRVSPFAVGGSSLPFVGRSQFASPCCIFSVSVRSFCISVAFPLPIVRESASRSSYSVGIGSSYRESSLTTKEFFDLFCGFPQLSPKREIFVTSVYAK